MRQQTGEAAKDLKSAEGSSAVTATATDETLLSSLTILATSHASFSLYYKAKISLTSAIDYFLLKNSEPGEMWLGRVEAVDTKKRKKGFTPQAEALPY